MTIGERIKLARENKHLSQKKLGSLINISPSTLSRYEQNHVKGIDNKIIGKIAKALGVSIEYLQGFTDTFSDKIIKVKVIESIKDGVFTFTNEIAVASFALPKKELFYLVSKDSSMMPQIKEGALVLFQKSQDVIDNTIVCVLPHNSTVPIIRKLRTVRNRRLFLPLDLSQDIYCDDVENSHIILGKAIQVIHDL
ncbi:helix-turn-helix domain-containing protein [Fundicoccus sp. Sow4_D5]|uniref:helix-turn-helix domain-containing protein n=1 Tax=unclassified Fundicoccus TaxID=2761543 RepID=UPI003F8F2B82